MNDDASALADETMRIAQGIPAHPSYDFLRGENHALREIIDRLLKAIVGG